MQPFCRSYFKSDRADMLSIAVSAVAILSPCYGSFAATRKTTTLHAEDPGFPLGKPLSLQQGSMTTATSGSVGRLRKEPSSRRLEKGLELCDGVVTFTTHVITTKAKYAKSAAAADLDGDGDLDILLSFDDTIAWYENLNGTGDSFSGPQRVITNGSHESLSIVSADLDGSGDLFSGPQRVITNQSNGSQSVVAADLDGDGDLDVLAALTDDKEIAWYENLGGTGNFSAPQPITKDYPYKVQSVTAADLDGDGDSDVIFGSCCDVSWYQNLDGAGNFSAQECYLGKPTGSVQSVMAADIDGDADLDVMSVNNAPWAYLMQWYENMDGAGSFPVYLRQYVPWEVEDLVSAVLADIDGDGPPDVLYSYNDTVKWSRNGNVGWYGPRVITTKPKVGIAAVGDLDGDGDLDVLLTQRMENTISWFENLDGAGDFSGPQRIIAYYTDWASSVAAADLDGDADLDVLSASFNDGKIAWYENECRPRTPQPKQEPAKTRNKQLIDKELICVAWCAIFGITSVIVLGYVVHTSLRKGKNVARIIVTIVLSQYDYGSDTLFIGFQKFVTPTLFVAAIIAYFFPLAVFIVVYRRAVGMHLAYIYKWTIKTFVRHRKWDDLPEALIGIGSFVLFPFALPILCLVYLILLFIFISCKLMSVSFFAAKFFEIGGFDCTHEAFEVMFKRNIFSELVFESTGELIIVLVDYGLRYQPGSRSITGLSSWALLSIIGSVLMLVIEAGPYLYHIFWMGRGLHAGIAAVSMKLEFMPDKVLANSFMSGSLAYGDSPPAEKTRSTKSQPGTQKHLRNSKVHDSHLIELGYTEYRHNSEGHDAHLTKPCEERKL